MDKHIEKLPALGKLFHSIVSLQNLSAVGVGISAYGSICPPVIVSGCRLSENRVDLNTGILIIVLVCRQLIPDKSCIKTENCDRLTDCHIGHHGLCRSVACRIRVIADDHSDTVAGDTVIAAGFCFFCVGNLSCNIHVLVNISLTRDQILCELDCVFADLGDMVSVGNECFVIEAAVPESAHTAVEIAEIIDSVFVIFVRVISADPVVTFSIQVHPLFMCSVRILNRAISAELSPLPLAAVGDRPVFVGEYTCAFRLSVDSPARVSTFVVISQPSQGIADRILLHGPAAQIRFIPAAQSNQ